MVILNPTPSSVRTMPAATSGVRACPGQRRADAAQHGRACSRVHEGKPVQEHPRRERADDQVLDAGFQREQVLLRDPRQAIQADGRGFQPDVHRHELAGGDEHHHAQGRGQEERRQYAPLYFSWMGRERTETAPTRPVPDHDDDFRQPRKPVPAYEPPKRTSSPRAATATSEDYDDSHDEHRPDHFPARGNHVGQEHDHEKGCCAKLHAVGRHDHLTCPRAVRPREQLPCRSAGRTEAGTTRRRE